VMDQGRVVQEGPPQEVYDRPASRFVAEFLGSPPMSLWPCEVGWNEEALRVRPSGSNWRTAWVLPEGERWVGPLRERGPGRVDLGVRPEQLELFDRSESPALPPPPARWEAVVQIRRLEPLGHETLAALTLGPHQLTARLPSRTRFRVGDRGLARFDPSRASWFDAETGTALQTEADDEPRRTQRTQRANR
jgi:multiple sugar transport system ATP-binding protein